MYCRKCGNKVNENEKFCPQCGHEIFKQRNKTCPNCGGECKQDAKFCNVCGAAFEQNEENNISTHVVEDTVSSKKTTEIKVEAGARALNGERQLISIFNIDDDGNVESKHYMRTTKLDPKFTYSFKKSSVVTLERKKTPIFSFVDKLRLAISVIFILLGFFWFIATWPFLLIGLALGGLTYFTRRWPTLIVQLKTGEKIKVYYEADEDIAELSRLLVE